jgi:translation initiation factor 1
MRERHSDTLVYSSEDGSVANRSALPARPTQPGGARRANGAPADGVVRIWLERHGRNGKPVSIVRGLRLDATALAGLAAQLKRTCGSGGTAKDGKIRLSSDPRATWKEPATLVVSSPDHPGVQWTGTIAVRYDCEVHAYFEGSAGTGGSGGRSGKDGDSPGGDGGDGSDGSEGNPGHDGQSVEAWITAVVGPGQTTLVQAAVRGDGERSYRSSRRGCSHRGRDWSCDHDADCR